MYFFISTSSSRMGFGDKLTRNMLLDLVNTNGKLAPALKLKLKGNKHTELKSFIRWLFDEYSLNTSSFNVVPDGVREFIRCMSTTSPVCSYIFPSESIMDHDRSLTEMPVR